MNPTLFSQSLGYMLFAIITFCGAFALGFFPSHLKLI